MFCLTEHQLIEQNFVWSFVPRIQAVSPIADLAWDCNGLRPIYMPNLLIAEIGYLA